MPSRKKTQKKLKKQELMEKWTKLRENHVGSTKGKFGSAFNLDFSIEECSSDSCEERLRGLFDQLLFAFLREKSVSKCVRPVPVLSGDGRSVDLFKLFWLVRKIGGYENISVNNLWGFVAEECGLGFRDIPFVKLTYRKYLNELDQWLWHLDSGRGSEGRRSRVLVTSNLLSWELETGFKRLMSIGGGEEEKDIKVVEHSKDGEDITPDTSESELHCSPIGGNSEDRKHTCYNSNIDSLCNKHATDFELPDRTVAKNCGINGDMDVTIDGDRKFCVDDILAASAKRIIEKAVNGLNGFSTRKLDSSGKYSVEGSDSTIRSAKNVVEKVINKVQVCGEAIADFYNEKLSSQDNNVVSIPTKNVVEKVIRKADLSVNNADDEKLFCAQKGIDAVMPDKAGVACVCDSRKRKRESDSPSGMLKWLAHVAKHSDDPTIRRIPESSKWSKYGKEEVWVQALLAREALLIRRTNDANSGECLMQEQQKKMKMHPSMYEKDIPNHLSAEKLRCSKRIPSSTKHTQCSCCNSRPDPPNNVDVSQKEERTEPKPPVNPVTCTELPTNPNELKWMDMPVEKQVSIGPSFQAEVPEWTGTISESDSKWLGTRMCPLEDHEKKSMHAWDLSNRKHHVCCCEFPNSVECVRFHIAEKRLKLKQEIGALFYRWRFDRMGEEVSLSWTKEEEKKFKDMMRTYAAFPNKFWNYAYRFSPDKTREKLVSYYFNVFLVQRRSYQNRVTPNDVDSDDDEKECGSIGEGFGYKALNIPGSKSISCSLNTKSSELQ